MTDTYTLSQTNGECSFVIEILVSIAGLLSGALVTQMVLGDSGGFIS